MRCENCKYFELDTGQFTGVPVNYGRCSHSKIVDDLYVDPPKDRIFPSDGIYATCDEGRGELQVGKDFGCIHFEKI